MIRRVLASIVCAVAVLGSSPAFAEELALKRHELGGSGQFGVGGTGYDYYDATLDSVTALGVGVEYAYRISPRFRVGAEGSRTAFRSKGSSDFGYASLWSVTPFAAVTWGDGTIQGGFRAGFGLAYGGRRPRATSPDREGVGFDAHLLGELAVCGTDADFFVRLGLRVGRTSWNDTSVNAHLYPSDFPVGMAFVALGGRFKL